VRSAAAADKVITAQHNNWDTIFFIATARLSHGPSASAPGRMPKDLWTYYGRYFALQHTFFHVMPAAKLRTESGT
jgi:hypothetical protein